MFQSFTGSSRKPRQVNLSGRSPNPFASVGAPSGPQNTLANAQQNRLARQRERDRLNAARLLQRTWRGYRSRKAANQVLRANWDEQEGQSWKDYGPYESEAVSWMQVTRLLRFCNPRDVADQLRLQRCCLRHMRMVQESIARCNGGPWPMAYLRLEKACLAAMESRVGLAETEASLQHPDLKHTVVVFFRIVCFLASQTREHAAGMSHQYYTAAAFVCGKLPPEMWLCEELFQMLAVPLKAEREAVRAHEGFALKFLTTPAAEYLAAEQYPESRTLLDAIDIRLLANAISAVLSRSSQIESNKEPEQGSSWYWLLCSVIYLSGQANGKPNGKYGVVPDPVLASVVARLLSSVADEVNLDAELDSAEEAAQQGAKVNFCQSQLSKIVNQRAITGLLSQSGMLPQSNGASPSGASDLASYALTLLSVFPRRGEEIRMWLYRDSATSQRGKISTILYFWQAVKATGIYSDVTRELRTAITYLQPRSDAPGYGFQAPNKTQAGTRDVDEQWKIILIFFELYTFVLRFMDDEEFFSANSSSFSFAGRPQSNALPLSEVKGLATFLKNLGFTMCYYANEISPAQDDLDSTDRISNYFKISSQQGIESAKTQSPSKRSKPPIAGLTGMSLGYVKGLVTGLLRMVYERDSRRRFLPKDHLLMTSHFDMTNFIPAVVAEEEKRREMQAEDEDGDSTDEEQNEDYVPPPAIVGTRRTQQARNIERLQRQQRKASRKRLLQAVAPRQEILQNFPFFIPFETRVQIFREFVHLDQIRRRNGYVDPDTWRMSILHGPAGHPSMLERHHAKIRRKHVFEDAYEQFWDLGPALKEPIQITFVDQFDTVEAGIDGGGVTKEFLTSVTKEAFNPSEDQHKMFVENEQHLFYPNPSIIDELRESFRVFGVPITSPDYQLEVIDIKQRYEFMGRIIGKCLYEGILADITFAGFFLLKWALTGGANGVARESGYRANLNDLRELDEQLYQGLLKLKNYAGNVEDFALNFTITDTVSPTRTITRELRPNGSNIPVTNANRPLYIYEVARHRLQAQPYAQTAAFLKGLSSIIPPQWLCMFNQAELQTLVGGTSSSIDIDDLRANTQYGGLYVIGDDGQEHPTIRAFWRVMAMLSDEQRRAVIKFVTSTPRAPLLGFRALNPRFSIRDSGNDERRLPSTSTCVNLLKLPVYKSEQALREKLLASVLSGAGFDLS